MVDIEQRVQQAMDYFTSGYNCSQSVALAYEDILGIEKDSLATISAPFGGGMGRLREVCGAVSGMFMVAGFVYKANDPKNLEAKKLNYQAVQTLAKQFTDQNGSIVCRDLLGLNVQKEEPTPAQRTQEYYKKRPCKELVGMATRLVGEMLNEKNKTC
ncbi:MAG: C-GCAxxG-C-C family protein [Rikenellaceae bacterium]